MSSSQSRSKSDAAGLLSRTQRRVLRIWLFAGFLFAFTASGHAQTILLVHDAKAPSADESQLRDLVAFLGLRLETLEITSSRQKIAMEALRSNPAILAIVTPAPLLSTLDPVLSENGRSGASPIPILIFGINPDVDASLLARWSNGALDRCIAADLGESSRALQVGHNPDINGVLSGLHLPQVTAPVCRLSGQLVSQGQALVAIEGGGPPAPLLYETSFLKHEIFFAPQLQPLGRAWAGKPSSLAEAFSSVLPSLLFLHHVARDFAWHLDGHYANFTVDDPWLVQPYGNLDYKDLLLAMKSHNFHTTIAFIPWNYDRSSPEMVQMLHKNRSFYSLCLHGDNHDHREFGNYTQTPLRQQVEDLRQGIVRMDRMRALTGLDYDRFMVFPHAVAPEGTFAALQAEGFLGTANAVNVPLDQSFPADPLFLLRPYSTAYGTMLSLSRRSTEAPVSRAELAIQTFLGNPLLFYAHQSFFVHGTDAFNSTADLANELDPSLQWVSLGDLARHLYEVRRRDDGNVDVRMLSREMMLHPSPQKDIAYFVTAVSPPSNSVTGVELDGAAISYQRTPTGISFQLASSRQKTQVVRIRHLSDGRAVEGNIQRSNLRINILRRVSDIRDLYFSRFPLGRAVVDAYYRHHGEAWEKGIEKNWYLILILMALGCGAIWSKRHHRHPPSLASTIGHIL